jgi:serine/alanine adding enzyme
MEPAVDAALMQGATELAAQLGVRHVEFRERNPRPGSWPVRTDKVVMELPLESSAEQQWKTLGSKLRAQIRRPEREGAMVEQGGQELLDDFYAVFSRNMRDLGTPVYSRRLFEQVCKRFPGNTELIVVRIGGEPVAAGLLVHHGGTTEIPWASSLREWNRLGANMLLYWRAIRAAIDRQSDTFDFGRSSRDSGTYRFKAQWGAQPSQLYWHYWLPEGANLPSLNPENPRFALAVRTWQRLPLWLANRLGPLLVRKLP